MPAPQSAHENPPALLTPGAATLTSSGLLPWTLKMMFELGNRMPRISCAMLPAGGNVGAWLTASGTGDDAAGDCAAGIVISFSAASSTLRSAGPAGNFP